MAKLIVEQQDMSVGTLLQLRAHGVIDDVTLLRVGFDYDAPGESEARQLAAFLVTETDYDVEVTRVPRKGFRRSWAVTGRTQETAVSSEMIAEWIRWMVLAGDQHGECRFDGWGASASA